MHTQPAVIFDIDGVLVDSYRAHLQSWQAMAAGMGRELTEAQFAATFGRISREIIAECWGAEAFTPQQLAEFDQNKEALYRQIVEADFPAMDGATELITALHAAGFPVALGSSGPPANVQLAIDRLQIGHLVSAIVTGADVTRGKPDPQVFLIGAERLGVPPARCAVVEDAPAGIAAANAAGMTSIALLSTGHTAESVAAAKCLVHSLRELSPERIAELVAG
jgi:beta-phosphoglucomutase